MTGIIKTDKLQSSAGNDAVTVASNGSITTAGITSTTGTFTGKVGIGTTSPPQKFVVSNAGADNIVMAENSSASIQMFMQAQSGVGAVGTLTNHDTVLLANNGEKGRFLAGGGLTFNGDTAAANALDDYEEGTWTPSDQSGAGMSLTVWEAFYTKIGRKVYIEIGFLIPSNSSSAVVSIGGLPYTSKSGNDNTGGFTLTGSNAGRLDYWLVNRGYTKFGASTYNNVGAPNSSYSNKQIKLCGSYTTA